MSIINPFCKRCGGIKRDIYKPRMMGLAGFHRVCCCETTPEFYTCDNSPSTINATFSGTGDAPCCGAQEIIGVNYDGTWLLDHRVYCTHFDATFNHNTGGFLWPFTACYEDPPEWVKRS